MAKLTWALSSDIVDHYEVVNTSSPILESKIGRVDFRTMSLAVADDIFSKGTDYLKKIKKKPVTDTNKSPSK